jgi:glycosyltransferase involved in cell wall biosynthesis
LILEALSRIGRPTYRLVIVGPINRHVRELLAHERYSKFIVALDSKPKEQMPRYLDLADAIVLPLSDNLLARSQMPCKVFEAMAMAKPVIGSAISDLPLVLEGCGKVVPPDDPDALANAIETVFADENASHQLGIKAREKCLREYSLSVSRKRLLDIMNRVLGG